MRIRWNVHFFPGLLIFRYTGTSRPLTNSAHNNLGPLQTRPIANSAHGYKKKVPFVAFTKDFFVI